MRILYLAAPEVHTSRGGIQRYARDVGEAMAARGHDVHWLRWQPDAALADLSLRDRVPAPTYWHPFYFQRGAYVQDYRFHQRAARDVARACGEFRPDLIHSFHLYNVAALAARPRPVSVTCHGLEVLAVPPAERMLRQASSVHCNSNFTASVARRVGPSSMAVRVLTWGVRGSESAPDAPDYDLITVGRLVRRKNVDTVLRALARLPTLRYAVVGDGPERSALTELAQSLRLPAVQFLGTVSDEQMHGLLRRSRLLVMLSRASPRDFEGLGLVYYEAHGHGLPVLGANTGGIPEAVGDAGVLVDDPDDVQAVARAIESTLAPETMAALRRRVQVRQRTHSWDQFIDAFERWHEEVAGG